MTITLRSVKGSALTHAEMDANFTDLAARPTITPYDLADAGATTLTPATGFAGLTDIFLLTGAAGGNFDITVANGTVVNQQIRVVVTGTIGSHTVSLLTAAASNFSAVHPLDVIEAWWTGSTWTRRDVGNSVRGLVSGSGSPIGSVVPGKIDQVYRDNATGNLYQAHGFTNTSWTKFYPALHDELEGYDAEEHVNHTSVSVTAGTGLTGGGPIDAEVPIAADIASETEAGTGASAAKLLSVLAGVQQARTGEFTNGIAGAGNITLLVNTHSGLITVDQNLSLDNTFGPPSAGRFRWVQLFNVHSTNTITITVAAGAGGTGVINGATTYQLPSGGLVTLVAVANAGDEPQCYAFGDENIADECIIIPVSDETTALTTGAAKYTFRMPFAMALLNVRASVNTAPTGATLIVDINEGGTSIMTTNKLSIDAGEKTSTTAAIPAGITDAALADDAEISIDIDQIGSTIAGAGLKVTFSGRRL